jgi:DNA topoisomerase-1
LQYRYHEDWASYRQQQKFAALTRFVELLPRLRRRARKILDDDKMNTAWMCAAAVCILNETGMRIGSHDNSSAYGLTTLRQSHLSLENDELEFEFRGKHGKKQHFSINENSLIKSLESLDDIPGDRFLRYRRDSEWVNLDHDDVNTFIQTCTRSSFSSKYFRTWTATRLACFFAKQTQHQVKDSRKQFLPTLVQNVAKQLGHTPTICAKYYIHPHVQTFLENHHENGGEFPRFNRFGLGKIRLSPCEKYAKEILESQ